MMFAAAVKGNAPIIRALLQAGVKGHPEADTGDDMFRVPLHAAAANNNLECLQVLLEGGGVDVNAVDDLGGTALMRASWRSHPTIVKFLLEEKNADLTIRQTSDVNALEFAAGAGSLEITKMLLDHPLAGVAGDQKKMKETGTTKAVAVTPLALAAGADSGNVQIVRFLLERGGYPSVDEDGNWLGERLSPERKKPFKKRLKEPHQSQTLEFWNFFSPFSPTNHPRNKSR
jgi:hypothetical protein